MSSGAEGSTSGSNPNTRPNKGRRYNKGGQRGRKKGPSTPSRSNKQRNKAYSKSNTSATNESKTNTNTNPNTNTNSNNTGNTPNKFHGNANKNKTRSQQQGQRSNNESDPSKKRSNNAYNNNNNNNNNKGGNKAGSKSQGSNNNSSTTTTNGGGSGSANRNKKSGRRRDQQRKPYSNRGRKDRNYPRDRDRQQQRQQQQAQYQQQEQQQQILSPFPKHAHITTTTEPANVNRDASSTSTPLTGFVSPPLPETKHDDFIASRIWEQLGMQPPTYHTPPPQQMQEHHRQQQQHQQQQQQPQRNENGETKTDHVAPTKEKESVRIGQSILNEVLAAMHLPPKTNDPPQPTEPSQQPQPQQPQEPWQTVPSFPPSELPPGLVMQSLQMHGKPPLQQQQQNTPEFSAFLRQLQQQQQQQQRGSNAPIRGPLPHTMPPLLFGNNTTSSNNSNTNTNPSQDQLWQQFPSQQQPQQQPQAPRQMPGVVFPPQGLGLPPPTFDIQSMFPHLNPQQQMQQQRMHQQQHRIQQQQQHQHNQQQIHHQQYQQERVLFSPVSSNSTPLISPMRTPLLSPTTTTTNNNKDGATKANIDDHNPDAVMFVSGIQNKIKKKHYPSRDAWQKLNSVLDAMLHTLGQRSRDFYPSRERVRKQLESLVQSMLADARVACFGSMVSGLCHDKSDMDVTIIIPEEKVLELPSPPTPEPSSDEDDEGVNEKHDDNDDDDDDDDNQKNTNKNKSKHKNNKNKQSDRTDKKNKNNDGEPRENAEQNDADAQEEEKQEEKKIDVVDQKIRFLVENLGKSLEEHGYKNVLALPKARVPIVKCVSPCGNIDVDIGINNRLAVRNSELVRDYTKIDPRLSQLVFLVKHWAKRRKINDPYRGTLSSYAYVLMIIHFLQTRPTQILPCLQQMSQRQPCMIGDYDCSYFTNADMMVGYGNANKETVAQLLVDFLHFWAHEFDYRHAVVSVRHGAYLSKEYKRWTHSKGRNRHWVSIEDPFEITHDLGRVCDRTALHEIRGEFMRAHRILRESGDFELACEIYTDEWRGS